MAESNISKSAKKRLDKAMKKDAEKAEKPVIEQKIDESALDSAEYFEMRKAQILSLRESGVNTHIHKFKVDMDSKKFVNEYEHIETGTKLSNKLSLSGRVTGVRESGSKLSFIDFCKDDCKVQVVMRLDEFENKEKFADTKKIVKLGDIIGVTGFPGKTNKGELSVFATDVVLLSPCLQQMPHVHFGLKDKETRYRQRYLDLMMNSDVRDRFIMRDKIVQYIRRFLQQMGFLEVTTPTMNLIHGGATAKPFITYFNAYEKSMFMRVAPELYLKKLVVGGFPRVFEIGQQWRNEDADLTHNPEFTSCEFYMQDADYLDLIEITETLLSGMVQELFGTKKIKYSLKGEMVEVDFTPPFRRIEMMPGLEEKLGVKLPNPTELDTEEARLTLDRLCSSLKVDCSAPRTTARLLDKLVGEYLEPECVNPAFIINHPQIMSPLAKWHRSKPGLTERFECFVLRHELCNAYTELNCPIIQRERLEQQVKDKDAGDDEAMCLDEDFLTALSYGLPPTAGWGLGIDRLVMYLTNTESIREVILFPMMKPVDNKLVTQDKTEVEQKK